jgi:hypothetical protein
MSLCVCLSVCMCVCVCVRAKRKSVLLGSVHSFQREGKSDGDLSQFVLSALSSISPVSSTMLCHDALLLNNVRKSHTP